MLNSPRNGDVDFVRDADQPLPRVESLQLG
jgi:hypothetical protein